MTDKRDKAIDLRTFKKVELHRHLEGALRVETLWDIQKEAGLDLKVTNLAELKALACIKEPVKDLRTMIDRFDIFQRALATPAIIERISYENCIDAFNDGIRILELRYSPSFICFGHSNLSFDVVHRSVTDGIARAKRELGKKLSVGLVAIITREYPLAEAEKTVDFMLANRGSFVGLDLAGDEAGYGPEIFSKLFQRARGAGLGITVHSGEVPGRESALNVKKSVEILGATRIGHGIQVAFHPDILSFVKEKKVVLEVCPTSNVLTNSVNDISNHPLRFLYDKGVAVTLNSDDPTLFDLDLTHEYLEAAAVFFMDESDFQKMNETALAATFNPREEALAAWNA